ncbi:MAG: hypothetical protein EOM37_02790 [Proteobacteria bacterium]|jgi:hypothetical protein|nr:hypothetical protein [Alphaproteobacteria bacterium]NCC02964.1 hypothetical protein [Pseudomonadota bacterium]
MLDPKDRKHIVGLVAENENGVLEASSRGYGEIWKECGYSYEIIDLFQPDGITRLSQALGRKDLSFVFGFAGVGSQLENDKGQNLWEAIRIPFVSLWYDHPCYNYRQHAVDSSYVINVYHVRDHFEVKEKYLRSRSNVLLLPIRGVRKPWQNRAPLEKAAKWILFVKTADNPADIETTWQGYPMALREILFDLAALAKANRNLDLADATAQIFQDRRISTENADDFFGVMQEVDRYIRGWRSDKMARAMLPHPSRIIGRGWDYLIDIPRRTQFHKPCSMLDMYRSMAHFSLCANTNPLWRDGLHERVYYSMMLGAVTITDKTERSDALFGDLPQYQGFEWNDDLSDVIAQAFALCEVGQDYRASGYQAVCERLAFDHQKVTAPVKKAVEDLWQTPPSGR